MIFGNHRNEIVDIDGYPQWFVHNNDELEIMPTYDGKICRFRARGVGYATLFCLIDAQFADGVTHRMLEQKIEFTILQREIVKCQFPITNLRRQS